MGMAFDTGFLDWRSDRPRRVLYIDGEMPAELLIQRITDAARRSKRTDLIDNLMVLSTEEAEAIAKAFPDVGMFEPLNTAEGHQFIMKLCELLKPDAVIFDNVQCLLAGVQKEEETWLGVLPLVQWLTAKRIGQLWFDHANSQAKQYGSMVKSWRFDLVGQMTALPEDQRSPRETAFLLTFDPAQHGKARRRTPNNWQEFAPRIIRLRDDEWTSEAASDGGGSAFGSVAPSRRKFHDALVAAICRHGGTGFAGSAEWQDEAQRRGLIDPSDADETPAQRRSRLRDFRKAKSDLITAGWIVVDGERVTDMKGRWE
jgi:hypothetical protein